MPVFPEQLGRGYSHLLGPYHTYLLKINSLTYRIPFIRDGLVQSPDCNKSCSPLTGLKILDVGCGGGIVSEVSFFCSIIIIIIYSMLLLMFQVKIKTKPTCYDAKICKHITK